MGDFNILIRDVLKSWGLTFYAGVTGGGVIRFLRNIDPFGQGGDAGAGFFNIGEYNAGFAPLGCYLSSGKIGAAVATTGAATKLLSCGLSDAKLHDIPAVYIVPMSGGSSAGFSPLQDTSVYGSNAVGQLMAELPVCVFVLNARNALAQQLARAKKQLDRSRPIVLVLDNESLVDDDGQILDHAPEMEDIAEDSTASIERFIDSFRSEVKGKRLLILVGEEMDRYGDALFLTSELCRQLRAAAVWSINGANAVDRSNPYGYGYISFGGNDKALSLFNSLAENDVLLILGACPDEYTANFRRFTASSTFYVGGIAKAYGLADGSLEHLADGRYWHLHCALDVFLESLIGAGREEKFRNIAFDPAPEDLNDRPFGRAGEGFADMAELYLRLDRWWPQDSIGFDDVCLAYKDRQHVVQRPNNNIKFYSLYRGSAMGGAFGAAVGAKMASSAKSVFLFTGDGCFRLFAGSMGEASTLGLVMFLLNNETLGIVEQGLSEIMPDTEKAFYHSKLKAIDYCAAAEAFGWDAFRLDPDLNNLDNLLDGINGKLSRSVMIEVPVDAEQILGRNPRLKNL